VRAWRPLLAGEAGWLGREQREALGGGGCDGPAARLCSFQPAGPRSTRRLEAVCALSLLRGVDAASSPSPPSSHPAFSLALPLLARSKATKKARVGYRATLFGWTASFDKGGNETHAIRIAELAPGAAFPTNGFSGNAFDILPGMLYCGAEQPVQGKPPSGWQLLP
jgi:hypothetical protein